ncbi:hypothetical protein ACGFRB_00545 [Streptomyces sp. NPDC048718]|uniref:hypothetical protein n=1 Tax=Streptomyces sp. NPDC048718 TaxID=3365587 RepID=UPI003715DA3B
MNAILEPALVMGLVLLPALLVVSLWKTARGVRTRGWARPGWWVFPATLLVVLGCGAWFSGITAGGLDIRETCAEHGAVYDDAYRAEHWREPGRWFPLHNRCNADADMVPSFVNPTLVTVALLLLVCAAGAVKASVNRRRRESVGGKAGAVSGTSTL